MNDRPERWTQATVYPDMWADPADDPRTSDGVSPDGELATLQDYLTNYRLTLLMKCDGLTPEQLARRSVPPSTMSLLGLLRHLADAERDWRGWILPEVASAKLYGPGDADFAGAVAVRELWVHRIEECARHCGHADLLRECIDGRVGQ